MTKWNRPEVGLLVLRVAIGLIFLLHGGMNLIGGRESFMREILGMVGMTLPDWLLLFVTLVEFFGGIALLAGLYARLAALVLACEMVVVVLMFHLQQGFFIVSVPNVPLAYGFEYHVALIGGLVCIAFGGPGVWAVESTFVGAGGDPRV
ncbi:MAG: DoxX family protein [Gemmatimonadales bacterium]